MKIDHLAIQVPNPTAAAEWYSSNFEGKILYSDETWSIVKFGETKLAFVLPKQHPAHFAFEVQGFDRKDKVKTHRDGSQSVYKKDPWGNIYELIKY
tara:strand:+ start:1863 stop:2150 length:288 start_codon:yes stop_codon:yes gene_type:complete